MVMVGSRRVELDDVDQDMASPVARWGWFAGHGSWPYDQLHERIENQALE